MKADLSILELDEQQSTPTPTCADCDEDCPEVENKGVCWLYAPERGMCPYLRPQPTENKP